jgi:hypothetical protein
MKLSPTQRAALALLAVGPLIRARSGWRRTAGIHATLTPMRTVIALCDRGLVKIMLLSNRKRHRIARITDAGRRLTIEAVGADAPTGAVESLSCVVQRK